VTAFLEVANWIAQDTSTHQDHVIAHVVGATVLGYFVWDESIYLLLDIGFIWQVYLDCEMGLLPVVVAVQELEAAPELKEQLSADVDLLLKGADDTRTELFKAPPVECLITEVNQLIDDDKRLLVIVGEEGSLAIETSTASRQIVLKEWSPD
jgi:hypothetical protein